VADPLLKHIHEMKTSMRSDRGFSINELMLTVAVAATLMAIAVPILTDVSAGARFNASVRMVERELQSARLKAVNANTVLRVRTNCPSAGFIRTVEVVGNAGVDNSPNRCDVGAYPFPPADTEMTTRPNHDGPVRVLPDGTAVGDIVLQFSPDGTVMQVVSNAPQRIDDTVSLMVSHNYKYKSVTINGAGKIQLADQ
jgi:prepilin-type N-terminal cleavage/methylation domain-containing protein